MANYFPCLLILFLGILIGTILSISFIELLFIVNYWY